MATFTDVRGSFLDAITILSTAQRRDVSSLSVSSGINSLHEDGKIGKFKSFERHKDYDLLTKNDIAIIKLSSPLHFNENVQPITLRSSNIGDNNSVTLSGWGTAAYPGHLNARLKFAQLNTISVESGNNRFDFLETVKDSEVCTLDKYGDGSCYGDSGGPLVDSNGQLVGIATFGRDYALAVPNVFTRVHSFLNWIEENRK